MRTHVASGHQTVQQHRPAAPACRTAACNASHSQPQSTGLSRVTQKPNQISGGLAAQRRAPAAVAGAPGPKAPNYRVQTPIPLGRGSQQIRATIPGTPQVAGSVEIIAKGRQAFISNLQVDQQHRRRGVAAKLIDAALANARRQGFKTASLEARPSDNGISPQALVAMYRRQGFKSIGKSFRGSPLMERKL